MIEIRASKKNENPNIKLTGPQVMKMAQNDWAIYKEEQLKSSNNSTENQEQPFLPNNTTNLTKNNNKVDHKNNNTDNDYDSDIDNGTDTDNDNIIKKNNYDDIDFNSSDDECYGKEIEECLSD